MELINDIPRLYTGLAEWAGCLVVLLICRRKVRTVPFIAISAAAAVIQCGFLMVTADIEAGIVWILVMAAAFFLMFLMFFCVLTFPQRGRSMARSPLFCMRSLRRPLNGSCTSGFSGVFRSARRSLFCCL